MSKYLINDKIYECSFLKACDIAIFDNGVDFFKRIGAKNGWKFCVDKKKFVSVFMNWEGEEQE